MTLMIDNPSGGSPTASDAELWRDNWGLSSIYVVADPNYSMVPGASVGTPQGTIVDPRTMEVLYVEEGWYGSFPAELTQLANQNM
jgi:hypothetical protein